MSLEIADGRIAVTDGLATVFDTNEALFVATDFITGTVSIPARSASTRGSTLLSIVNTDVNYTLTQPGGAPWAVNPAATIVRGAFAATVFNPNQTFGTGWFNANGTAAFPIRAATAGMQTFTFFCSNGVAYLNERSIAQAPTSFGNETRTVTLVGLSLQYKLFCGTFV